MFTSCRKRILYFYNSFPEIIASLFQATVDDFDLIHRISELECSNGSRPKIDCTQFDNGPMLIFSGQNLQVDLKSVNKPGSRL